MTVEQKTPSPRRVFGVLGMTSPASQIERVISGYPYPENVTFLNSVISPDKPRKGRFEEAADNIVASVSQGPLDVVVCSMGTTELMFINKIIKKKHPGFFEDLQTKERLRFFANAESGANKTIKDRIRYLKEIVHMVRNPGLDVMYAFPTGVSPEDMSDVFSDISNKKEGYSLVSLPNPRSNEEFIPEDQHAELEIYKQAFRAAVEARDSDGATRVREEGGNAFRGSMLQIFDGAPSPLGAEKPKLQLSVMGLRVLTRALGNKPNRKLQQLQDMGYEVYRLVGEFDRVQTLEAAEKKYADAETARSRIMILEGFPHSGLALQPEHIPLAIDMIDATQ